MLVAQSCLTHCDPMDYSPPGSSVYGILQVRILEWVAILFFRESSLRQGLNVGLLHFGQVLYRLSHQGSHLFSLSGSDKFFCKVAKKCAALFLKASVYLPHMTETWGLSSLCLPLSCLSVAAIGQAAREEWKAERWDWGWGQLHQNH